jgi:hypothetical protein
MKQLLPYLLALTTPLLAGCGGSKLHPVKGKVVYEDGTPVKAGMVVIERMDAGEGQRYSANGAIQPDGTFELGTRRPEDGAPEGRYRAAVVSPPLSDDQVGKGERPLVEARFSSLDTSGLELEVKPGVNEVTLTVARPGGRRPAGKPAASPPRGRTNP